MPNQMQRVQAAKANYRGSALEVRNAALRRASMLGAVLVGAKGHGLERLQASGRLLTVQDYCQSAFSPALRWTWGVSRIFWCPTPTTLESCA